MPRGKPRLGATVEQAAADKRRPHGLLVRDALREALKAIKKGSNEPDHRTRLQAVKLWMKLRDGKGRKARVRGASAVGSEGKPSKVAGVRRAEWAQPPATVPQVVEVLADPASVQPDAEQSP